MEFNLPYLLAMREQAPKMFIRLRRTGALKAHVSKVGQEARRMYAELAKDKPKLPNGLVEGASVRQQIEERVFAALIEFPPDDAESQDETIPGDQARVSA